MYVKLHSVAENSNKKEIVLRFRRGVEQLGSSLGS